MSGGDDHGMAGDLGRIYRAHAHERPSSAIEATLFATARAHARRKRVHERIAGFVLAAAIVLIALVFRQMHVRAQELEAIKQHYAAVTLPWMLDARAHDTPFQAATRCLLQHCESEQAGDAIDELPQAPEHQG